MIYGFWLSPLVSFGNIVVCSSWFTNSDYPLVSFGHCVVCSSMIYRFWLPPWYLLTIVLSVLLWYTDSDYTLGIFWPLCCLFFYAIQILIMPLVSFGNCVVCSSMIYGFWISIGIFWPLCCLFFYDIQILITPLVSFGHCVVCSSMIYMFWIPLGIFWPLCCLFYDIQNLITLLVSFDHCVVCSSMIYRILITPLLSFGHRVVCSSMIYRFWLQPWYLLVIVLSVLLWYTDSEYPLGIFWQLCCLFFYDIQILITPLVSFGHCVVCFSMIYRFWFHPWYLSAIVLSVLWYTDSDYPLGIFWPLCCLFYDI